MCGMASVSPILVKGPFRAITISAYSKRVTGKTDIPWHGGAANIMTRIDETRSTEDYHSLYKSTT